jgi:hypothetical protein
MNNRQYTYKELIEAYINAERDDYIHEDFKNYYVGLFKKLTELFGIRFRMEELGNFPDDEFWPGVSKGAALMVFQSTVRSYLSITTPFAGFIEFGLGVGDLYDAYGRKLEEMAEENRKAHLNLLDALFKMMSGAVDRVVTSQELREAGFDDSKEPKKADYYDYM